MRRRTASATANRTAARLLRRAALPLLASLSVFGSLLVDGTEPALFAQRAYAQEAVTAIAEAPTPSPTPAMLPTPVDPAATIVAAPSPTAIDGVPTEIATIPGDTTVTPLATPTPPPLPMPIAEGTVDDRGGVVVSNDGRVTVEFPAGAVTEPLSIKVTPRGLGTTAPPSPNTNWVGLWDFEASATARSSAPVHQFASDVTITLRFPPDELRLFNAKTLAFWTYDDASQTWLPIDGLVDAANGTLTVKADHFSGDGATAAGPVDLGPLLDGHNANLHSGSTSLSIPIQVAPGRGGVQPELVLSYDSGRVGDMRKYDSVSGWVGQGWDLGTGSIQIDGNRAFLEMAGIGGELIQKGPFNPEFLTYYLRDDPYIRVTRPCQYDFCPWTVTDKTGRKYVFGGESMYGDDAYMRWYYVDGIGRIYYRADLMYVQDVFGNRMDYSYVQQRVNEGANGSCQQCDVVSAYPDKITYNANGSQPGAEVRFVIECDETPTWPAVCMRRDTPRDTHPTGCSVYTAPLALETRRLTAIQVVVDNQLVRQYDLGYNTTAQDPPEPFYWLDSDPRPDHCGTEGHAGNLKLLSLSLRDNSGVPTNPPLYSMNFEYLNKDFRYRENGATVDKYTFNWPHLVQADNGFGGSVFFDYEEKGVANPGSHWSRQVVATETHRGYAGQPDVVTGYSYGSGPDYWDDPITIPDPVHAEYRGFRAVTQTDVASGTSTEHDFYTTGGWGEEIRTGREYQTIVRDSQSNVWQRTQTQWLVRPVDGFMGSGTSYWRYMANFLSVGETRTYLKDGTLQRSVPFYDDYGNVEKTVQFSDHRAVAETLTPYHKNTTDWIFVPKYEEARDPQNRYCLLNATKMYYDGANSSNTAPTKGLVTATSAQLTSAAADACTVSESATSANSYTAYDSYGNAVRSSVATAAAPETIGSPPPPPAGATYGWIPGGLASSSVEYDALHHLLPVKQTNPLGQFTKTSYDPIWQKPLTVAGPMIVDDDPDAHKSEMRYDQFGRIAKVWDNYDSENAPTQTFSYFWGSVPNRTLIQRKTNTTGGQRNAVSCLDGFAREVEHRENYQGTLTNRVRTDYDASGRRFAQTSPDSWGDSSNLGCPAQDAFAPVSGFDRTKLTYDAVGNVQQTMFVAAGQTSGPYTQSIQNGKQSTLIDENFHQTTKVQNLTARTLSVTEPGTPVNGGGGTTIYRYDGLGHLAGVTDAVGNVTSISYDMAGRKVDMVDPDMGHWTYQYNVAGGLTEQNDARGVKTSLEYDGLERLRHKSYQLNGQPYDQDINFYFDNYDAGTCGSATTTAIGRMTKMTDGAGQQTSCFDTLGRDIKTSRTIDGTPYDIDLAYDNLGQVTQLTYPSDGGSREVVTSNVRAEGDAYGMSSSYGETIVSNATRRPSQAGESVSLGNGLTTNYEYDFRQRLTKIQTGAAQTEILRYDDAGNVTCIADSSANLGCAPGGAGETATYSYDELNRLTGMSISGTPAASYTYNQIGNLMSKHEVYAGSLNPTDLTSYAYPSAGQPRPHAVTATAGTPALSLSYDANGNLATQSSSAYTYDAENRLKTRAVPDGSATYTYDGNGTLLKRTNADGTWTVYAGGAYEKNSDGSTVKYYGFGGRPVALRTAPTGGGSGTVSYLLTDHLGSAAATTNVSGAVVSSQKYWPYGATRSMTGTMPTDKLYTGQQQEPGDSALGLYNYKARFYSTTLGRFASADDLDDGLNRFSYVHANPLRSSDPTGHGCSAPRPCPAPVPSPADDDPREYCRQNYGACLTYSLYLKYGAAPHGLIIVMGIFQSIGRTGNFGIGAYEGYADRFLELYVPSCGDRSSECWGAIKELAKAGAADAIYTIFGVRFIESDPGGIGLGAAWSDRGIGALDDALTHREGKSIVGVIGHSLGAMTVAQYYAEHPETDMPFFLDSGPDFDISYRRNAARAGVLDAFAGRVDFFSCGAACGVVHHGARGGLAVSVLDAFDRYWRTGLACCAGDPP